MDIRCRKIYGMQFFVTFELTLWFAIFSLVLVHKCQAGGAGQVENAPPNIFLLMMKEGITGLKGEGLLILGREYAKHKDYEKAISFFTKAIDMNNKVPSYYVLRGNCYAERGKSELAWDDFDKAVRLAMESGKAETLGVDDAGLIRLGKDLYYCKKYETAAWCFSEVINKNPSVLEYYKLRMSVYDEMGEHDKCILDLKKIIELNHANYHVLNYQDHLIKKLVDAEKYDEAIDEALLMSNIMELKYACRQLMYRNQPKFGIRCYNELIKRDSENRPLHYKDRGHAYLAVQDVDNAISDFKNSVKLDPTSRGAWKNLLDALISAGKSNKVIVQEMQTANDAIIAYLGITLSNNNNNNNNCELAVLFYKEAIRRNPSDVLNYKLRAECYLKMKDHDMAIFEFKNALRRDPDDEKTRTRLILTLFKVERYKEAIEAAIVLNNEAEMEILSKKLFDLNKYEEVIRCCTETLKKNPNSAICLERRGFCYQKFGKSEEAISDFENLKKIGTFSLTAELCLCEALIEVGRYDEAAEILKNFDSSNDNQLTDVDLERIMNARKKITSIEINRPGTVASSPAVPART